MSQEDDFTDRGQFLNMAGVVEGGLVLLAVLLGWLADINPAATLRFEWTAVAWGLAATVPMFALFLLAHRFPVGPLLPIKQLLVELLGPLLRLCRWYDLVLLALLAGIGEELLFRGVLQPWIGRHGFLWGLLISNLLFGLAHAITPTYAVLAAVMGIYLGLLTEAPRFGLWTEPSESPNLLVPIVTHAVYDYLGFLVIVRDTRDQSHSTSPDDCAEDDDRSDAVEGD